ncbi:MAG: Asp-tRNA(Asn)/Glu-tRNA(Gln) amidotransferase GatCAB subunit A [Phycisphaerae bacterium]|nr:Asp-tRNA(Asn)/Glu-tRNA(Gln) amidotransferase GatCAB subunit A [Phycisphaerae bacterium]
MSSHPGVVETARLVREGKATACEMLSQCIDRIKSGDSETRAFMRVDEESARDQAQAVDAALAAGSEPGPLAGVPIAIKDNIVMEGRETNCGSRILEGFVSPYESTATQRLREAGAVLVGTVRCDEFAMGSSTEHCAYGTVGNPWATDHVPGGSSGGSAAAVAQGLVPAALGSDTGGSIRQPAALCGVTGLKPSYGRVSRWGLVAFGSSLDCIGPLTRSVEDSAAILNVIAGPDKHDSTSLDSAPPDYLSGLADEKPLVIGIPRQHRHEANDPAVEAAVEEARTALASKGATFIDVDLEMTDHGIATYYVVATAEASSNLARFDGIRYGRRAQSQPGESLDDLYARSRGEGFGPEVRRRIMLGTYVLSAGYYDAFYKKALQARRVIHDEYRSVFEKCDLLLGPTTAEPAFKIGSIADPITMYLCDRYTVGANIAGIPAISIPGGFKEAGGLKLPVGIQLQAPFLGEPDLLRTAHMLQQMSSHHLASPVG